MTAEGGGAGIGNGGNRYNETPGSISILGGTVKATSEFYGAGIGGSLNSSPVPVTISGGTVTAQGGAYGGAGIGGGLERRQRHHYDFRRKYGR